MTTYQDVMQAIRDGADAADVESMIVDPRAALTDHQMASLRAELAATLVITGEALERYAPRGEPANGAVSVDQDWTAETR